MLPKFAKVLFPLPLNDAFDYEIIEGLGLGDFVLCPFGKQTKIGLIIGFSETSEFQKTKPILSRLNAAPLKPEFIDFIKWTSKYLVVPMGAILNQVLRPIEALADGPYINKVAFGEDLLKPTDLQAKVLDFLKSHESPISKQELSEILGVSIAVISNLVKKNALIETKSPVDLPFHPPKLGIIRSELNEDQNAAKDDIIESLNNGGFAPFLLDGVTGSGKTEVYLEAINHVLKLNGQIMVLLPEIALTEAIINRIKNRFGTEPIIWHSEQTMAYKRRAWREIANGNAKIIVGARSAVFLPFSNLKLIIIDEEHDPSYKQEDGLRYQARDLAVVRAKYANAAIVLCSATPSLETRNNAKSGRYAYLSMPNRYGKAFLPNIELIDLKANPPHKNKYLSPLLIEAIADTLSRKEQVLLFLNRRGFAPVVICNKCGHRMMAPNSSSWLVEHKYKNRLICHLTGYSIPKPINCPSCHSYESLMSIGVGVERIYEEIKELYPKKAIEIFSSDTASSPEKLNGMIKRMEDGEIDIIIGTQIVAKGHNFPFLTLVGVIDGDLGLGGGDPRSGERTYQLLTQVAGRAGRTGLKSKAMIQTHYPEHEALQALLNNDRDSFLEIETEMRAASGMPPFGRLGCLHLMARDILELENATKTATDSLINGEGIEVWGPAPPPMALIRGWHRSRFLVRADKNIDLSSFMSEWSDRIKLSNNIRMIIDIEPYSFL